MIKFSECSIAIKIIVAAATVVSSVAVLAGAAAWAGDTRWVTVTAQAQSEQRQLKREIKKLQIEKDAGTATDTDKAYLQFLLQDLERLQQIDGG